MRAFARLGVVGAMVAATLSLTGLLGAAGANAAAPAPAIGSGSPASTPILPLLPTTTSVVATPHTATVGTPVTATATVEVLNLPVGVVVLPSGSVTFLATNNGVTQTLGSPNLPTCVVETCSVSVTTSALSPGTSLITAVYSGALLLQSSAGTTSVTMYPIPAITSVVPSAGPTAGGNTVTINGSGFTGATRVEFGATNNAVFTVNSDSSITATAPAHAAGRVNVFVTGPGGRSSTSAGDLYSYVVAPAITSVNPSTGPTAGGTNVVINGSGFNGATAVKFGGSSATTFTVVNDTRIAAVSPAHSAGPVNVEVTAPGGTSAHVAADLYQYVAPAAAPAVTGVAPSSGPLAGGTVVTLTGTGFTGATNVSFGGTNAPTFTVNNDTTITVTSPANPAGAVDVTVTGPNGTSATSAADTFTYVAAPTVTNVAPNNGPVAGGTAVTITGTGFTGATAVAFGGADAPGFVVVNDTTITVNSPAHAAGAVDVTVTTVGGTSATSAADTFTYNPPPAPTVTGVTPATGPVAGGTHVTITGTDFLPGTTVAFGATAAVAVNVVNATHITATAPAGAAGTVDVTVTNGDGTSAAVAADQFIYAPVPTVTGVTPGTGPAAGGTMVTITGTGFTGATSVMFGTVNAPGFTVVNDTTITVNSPTHSVGKVNVQVTTAGGTSAHVTADTYRYV